MLAKFPFQGSSEQRTEDHATDCVPQITASQSSGTEPPAFFLASRGYGGLGIKTPRVICSCISQINAKSSQPVLGDKRCLYLRAGD